MDFLEVLQLYALCALALAWTSYIIIIMPATDIAHEVLEKDTGMKGLLGFIIWSIMGTIFAPLLLIAFILIDNKTFIGKVALGLIDHFDEFDEFDE